ncbi:MAG: chloride channel protein [Candidatus Krumholzibacteriota bacterium]|nr:chloride channel protein [Candidatus Krumholzibacteriota bacterium]
MNGSRGNGAVVVARWIVVAAVTGVLGALLVAGFDRSLQLALELSRSLPRGAFLLPIAGAALVGATILRRVPGAGGEGIPSYLLAVNQGRGMLDGAATILKFPATVITLGSGCSGGIVGPLARMGAGIGSLVARLLAAAGLAGGNDARTAAVCGAAAAVSAIFHSPLGGAFFAAEILRRESMRYADLFPALLAGTASFVTSAVILGESPVFQAAPAGGSMAGLDLLWTPVAAIVAGGIGMLFIVSFRRAALLFRALPGGAAARAALGGLVVAAILLAGGRAISSTSMDLFADVASGRVFSGGALLRPALFLALLLLFKIAAVSATVGSGLSGGFTGPLVILGIGGGALVAAAAGVAPGGASWTGLLACGMSAALGAVMNIPIAAIIISCAVFGSGTVIPAAVGGVVSFVLFRSRTIYEYARVPADDAAAGGPLLRDLTG